MRNNSTSTAALYLRNEDSTADTRHPYLIFADGSGNRGGIGIQNDSSSLWISGQNGIAFRTSGSAPSQQERLRIETNGEIRQQSSSGSTIYEMKRTDSNTTGSVGTINFTASDDHSVASISAMGDGNNEGAHIVFRTTSAAANNSPYNAATPERVRITSGGDLGLGVSGGMDQAGTLYIVGGQGVRWTHPTDGTLYGDHYVSGGGQHVFRSGSGLTERLRIDADGILKTPNLQGNNRREIHRKIDGFNSGSSVVNYLLICETSRTNVRLAGRLFTARASGTSACSSQLFDITFQQNHNASHRSGSIMGLHSGSAGYGHAEAEFVSLTYNSTNYYAIRFYDGWVTDFDTCSFDGIREHTGTELFTHIDSTNDTITNVSVLTADTNKGDVTIQQADLRMSDGDIILADGHGISFSATANSSGSMSSEVLDDYEEGTFTPTVYGGSTAGTFNIVAGGLNTGWYVKIGQYVHMIIRWQNVYLTGASGNLTIGNLPFSFDNNNARLGGHSTYLEGFTPAFNKSFSGSQSVVFRRQSATAVTFRPSSSNEWDVYYSASSTSWQRNGGNSSQRTYGEIHLYGHTPS